MTTDQPRSLFPTTFWVVNGMYYAFSQGEVQPRMAVQALIFMALGFGGLMVGRGRAGEDDATRKE